MSDIAIRGEVLPALKTLAAEANHRHAECETSYKTALEHAWYAGRALADAKAQLQHGEWLPWLGKNFKGSQQHASRYMRIADADYSRVRNLSDSGSSLRAALKEISSSNGSRQTNEDDYTYCPTCGHRLRKGEPRPPRRDQ